MPQDDPPIRTYAQRLAAQALKPAGQSAPPPSPQTAAHPGFAEAEAKQWIAETAREIYLRKLSGATDGNLSIRLRDGRFATTPSGVHKGRLRPDDILVVDKGGQVTSRPVKARDGHILKPSSELALHLCAYRERSDIGAVVHAHPPMAIAYSLAGGDLSQVLVSEVIFACGTIATAPYSTPTTQQVPDTLAAYLRCYDVVMMHRHGSVTLGNDLDQAMARLDALEHTALIYCTAKMLGGAQPIAAPEIDRLFAIARPDAPWRQPGQSCPPAGLAPAQAVDERLVAAVVAALRSGSARVAADTSGSGSGSARVAADTVVSAALPQAARDARVPSVSGSGSGSGSATPPRSGGACQ